MSHKGGSERIAVNLAKEMVDKYEVSLLSMQMSNEKMTFSLDPRVEFICMERGHHKLGVLYMLLAIKHRERLNNRIWDVIICIGFETSLFPCLITSKNRRKIIFSEQNMLRNVYLKTRRIWFLRKFGVKHSDKVVVLSEDDYNDYCKCFNKYSQKICIIYNWIEDNLFSENNIKYNLDSKSIITVSRISPMKNYEDVINVAKIIKDKCPDWHWDLYGFVEGEYGNKILGMIKDNDLEYFLTVKGHDSNLYDKYVNYAFLVHTSKTEPFGLAFIEAQAKRLPIVAYNGSGAMREIITDGINGFLVQAGNYIDMSDKILEMINNQNTRKDMSMHTRDNFYKFDRKKIIDKWQEIIDE